MNIQKISKTQIKEFNISYTYSFIETFFLTFISELGSNTFVLLLFFREKTNKYMILLTSLLGTILMNLLSIILGYSFDFFINKNLIDHLSIILLISYSLISLYKDLKDKNFSEVTTIENQKKVLLPPLKISNIQNKDYSTSYKRNNKSLSIIPELNEDSIFEENNNLNTPLLENFNNNLFSPSENNNYNNNNNDNISYVETQITTDEQNDNLNENSIFNIFYIILTQIFISEFGEKVQITNIILSSTFNIQGVFFGSCFSLILICFISVFVNYDFILESLNQKMFNLMFSSFIFLIGVQIYLFKYNFI